MQRRLVLATILASATFSTLAAAEDAAPNPTTGNVDRGSNSAIVGGSDVVDGDWPDTVAVIGSNGSCTGTLIAPDVVLTAGHCANINPTRIIANTVDYAKSGGIRINVARTTAYPNWQSTYDVAVIELVAPVTGVEPRKLGMSCTFASFKETTNVHLVGFGATDMQGTAANTHLKEAMTAVVDPTCMGGRGCNKTVAPGGEFVAGGTGTADSCFGDSGGPVYLDTPNGTVVVGAVSRGVDGASTPCGGGGIYVRTDKIADWIEQTTGKTIAKDECAGESYDATGSDSEDDKTADDNSVGCSAAGGEGGASTLLVLMTVCLARRRRNRVARKAARAKSDDKMSAGQIWGQSMLTALTTKFWA